MPKTDYEQRQQEKKEAYERLANKNENLADQLSNESQKMGEAIPLGQPLMPDHHSYKSDLSYRKRMHNKMDKSIKTREKAEYYENKVKNTKSRTIFVMKKARKN